MIESEMYNVVFTFKNGDIKEVQMMEIEVDTMFDKLWERDLIKWMNIWGDIINLDAVQHIYYEEIEGEE